MRIVAAVLTLCVPLAALAAEPPSIKKRIAVFEFEDKTDGALSWWKGGQTVGQGMSDMLLTALVKSGRHIVVEREKINEVMTEQSLGASGAINQQSAASIGKVLGVELALFGAVTEFGIEEKERGGRAPVMTPMGRRRIGLKISKAEARVTVDVRLVNTSTGEIVAAESVTGTEEKRGVSVSSKRLSFDNEAEFDESMIGKATRRALETIVTKVGEQMSAVPWSGKIVKSDATSVIINAGSAVGVAVGDTLLVYAKGEELIDPDTGLSLGSEEKKIGTIVVSADIAEGRAARCTLVDGSGGQRGDIVRYVR